VLSRVADSLYWMSRYLERADHVARGLDVHLTIVPEQGSEAVRRRRRAADHLPGGRELRGATGEQRLRAGRPAHLQLGGV
jgi:uncharacterized alpha-E superfamily protein